MENLLLSDKHINESDFEYIVQNNELFYEAVENIFLNGKSKDEKSLNDDSSKQNQIRVPNLSLPSAYHNPQTSATQSELTESALLKLDNEYVILTDYYKPYTNLNSYEKRVTVLRFLLIFYHSKISLSTKQSRQAYCDMCIKTVKPFQYSSEKPQMYLNSDVYMEMLRSLYFIFYNGFSSDANKAIELISNKADEDLLVDVILMCNSLKSLLNQAVFDIHANGGQASNVGSKSDTQYQVKLTSENGNGNQVDSGLNGGTASKQINIANVIVSPTSVEERDAARRASMKLRTSKILHMNSEDLSTVSENGQSIQSDLNELAKQQEPQNAGYSNGQKEEAAKRDARLENIPTIDGENGDGDD